MQKPALAVVLALVAAITGVLVVPQLLTEDDAPVGRWSAGDEIELASEPAAAATTAGSEDTFDRTAVENVGASDNGADERVEVLIRGRVTDKFKAAVANATVWLDFGRGGPRGGMNARQRRVPEPVMTDREGRFAFQGQAFRNLRVSLQIAHERFAPGLFDKDLGDVKQAADLGDLVLQNGGQIRGRVTDLDGHAIPAAELRLQPQNGNNLRFLRDRDRLLPPITTDRNGYYVVAHATAGDWSLTATAARHQEGRSSTFVVEEDQAVDVPDIQLGPGFEVTGFVRNLQGAPVAKANVRMRSEERGRPNGNEPGATNGPGGPGVRNFAFGRDYTTTTDEQGRFFLDHLPGVSMRIEVDAEGFLDYAQGGIDTKPGQPLQIMLQDGLKILADVKDQDGTPVTLFAYRAVWLRPLPVPGTENLDAEQIITKLREGNLAPETMAQLRQQVESLRSQVGAQFPRGRGGPGQQGQGAMGPDGPGRGNNDLGRAEIHPEGRLVATGLQEGIYELHVQSPDHARYLSPTIELRPGSATPQLQVVLDGGVFVAGVVTDDQGEPVRGARVELRAPSAFGGRGRGRPNADSNAAEAAAPRAQGLEEMARQFVRQVSGAQVTLETTTDAEGVFVLKHATRGSWQLRAEARGFASTTSATFELTDDRSGFALELGTLGALEGTVAGLRAEEFPQARVAAVPMPNTNGGGGGMPGLGAMLGGRGGQGGGRGPFQTANVNADGSYRISDLVPGQYLVRSWVGDAQDLMREMMPQFFSGQLAADVDVRGGAATRFDLAVTRPQVGAVTGSITNNGVAAAGFQVELTRENDSSGNTDNGGFGMRGGPGGRGRGFGQALQAAVATSGQFKIEKIPAGSYQLRVTAPRQREPLYRETIQITADSLLQRDIMLTSYRLAGTAIAEDGLETKDVNGRAILLAGVAEMPEDLNRAAREGSSRETRITEGKFSFEVVPPGNFLLVTSVRGREPVGQAVVIGSDLTVSFAAGKAAPAGSTEATGPAIPGTGGRARGQNGGAQGGGGQGGGGPTGGRQRGGRQGQNGGNPPGGG